jgi:hypothetical protein
MFGCWVENLAPKLLVMIVEVRVELYKCIPFMVYLGLDIR